MNWKLNELTKKNYMINPQNITNWRNVINWQHNLYIDEIHDKVTKFFLIKIIPGTLRNTIYKFLHKYSFLYKTKNDPKLLIIQDICKCTVENSKLLKNYWIFKTKSF